MAVVLGVSVAVGVLVGSGVFVAVGGGPLRTTITSCGGLVPSRLSKLTAELSAEVSTRLYSPAPCTNVDRSTVVQVPLATDPELPCRAAGTGALAYVIVVSPHPVAVVYDW